MGRRSVAPNRINPRLEPGAADAYDPAIVHKNPPNQPRSIPQPRSWTLGLILCLLLATAGCRFASTELSKVLADPNSFHGRQVTVSGHVEAARWLPEVGAIAFKIVDGGDSLLVLTQTEPPHSKDGDAVRIEGRVHRAFPIGGRPRVVLFFEIGP